MLIIFCLFKQKQKKFRIVGDYERPDEVLVAKMSYQDLRRPWSHFFYKWC